MEQFLIFIIGVLIGSIGTVFSLILFVEGKKSKM